MKRVTYILFLLCIFTIYPPYIHAQQSSSTSLTVFPSIISLVLSPGKASTTTLTIKNNSNVPVPVRLTFEPLVLDDASSLPSIGSWITLSKNSLLIPAGEQEQISIQVALPRQIALGGYYGMLYLSPLSSVTSSSKSDIRTKIGVLLLGSVGVQNIPLNLIELQEPHLNVLISESLTRTLRYEVKNNALNHISAKPYLVIHPWGASPQAVQFDERLVFPGKKREWESAFTVLEGKKFYYQADLYVSIGNGLSQKKSFYFIIFPIKQSIILVLCIAIGISIIRKRKQIIKAFYVIIKG